MSATQTNGSSFLERSEIKEAALHEVSWPQFFPANTSPSPQSTPAQLAPVNFSGAVIGTLAQVTEQRVPFVAFPGNPLGQPVAARACVPLASLLEGIKLVLLFENANPAKPIIMGVVSDGDVAGNETSAGPLNFEIDGERMVYTAQKEIVLRCGKASIQLFSDGSVRIRGTNVLSRASATNHIRGGNVQIN